MPSAAVALLAEGVDRNLMLKLMTSSTTVALREEGVDRNDIWNNRMNRYVRVALLAEGADRNICYINGTDYLSGRLSATSCAAQ